MSVNSGGGGPKQKYDEEACRQAFIRVYKRQDYPHMSMRVYDSERRKNDPSSSTIKDYLGQWSEIHDELTEGVR